MGRGCLLETSFLTRGHSLENGGLERFLVLIRQTYWSFRVGMDPEEAESCKKERKKILTN